MNREEYEAKKKADSAQQQEKRSKFESEARARRDAKRWFFRHPDKIVKYTGYLQLFTAVLATATVFLFGATIYTAVVLHSTDEKIGRQLELSEADLRPYIFVDYIERTGTQDFASPFGWAHNEGAMFIRQPIHITNYGKAPAVIVKAVCGIIVVESGEPDTNIPKNENIVGVIDVPSGRVIGQHDGKDDPIYCMPTVTPLARNIDSKILGTTQWKMSNMARGNVWMVGSVTYQGLSKTYETLFCFQYRSTMGAMTQGSGPCNSRT